MKTAADVEYLANFGEWPPLPRWTSTGHAVLGTRTWPICPKCRLRQPPEPDAEIVDACICDLVNERTEQE
jgi:hypothetical protein